MTSSRFSRVELFTHRADKSMQFYGALFGWELGNENAGYWHVVLGHDESARTVFIQEDLDQDLAAYWLPVIEVENLSATLQAADANGARETESISIGLYTVGFITDPAGARFCVMERSRERSEEEEEIFGEPR